MLRKSGTRLSFLTMHIEGVVAFVVSSTLDGCSKNRLNTRLWAGNEEGWEEISTNLPCLLYTSITWIS